jgi:hypothetical protein
MGTRQRHGDGYRWGNQLLRLCVVRLVALLCGAIVGVHDTAISATSTSTHAVPPKEMASESDDGWLA